MKAIAAGLLLFCLPLAADEGMWLFNQFPSAQVKKKYGFDVTGAFLDHLRLSSARLNSGGSGSFVSPRGLLFTNHHVAADCIQKVATAEHDYMRDGFYAPTAPAEMACPDLEVNVLLSMETVTDRVRQGIPANARPEEANRQRKAAIARIEKEYTDRTGNRCDVVTLFSGERYDLYQYKKYTDVRLVFAPEFGIAFFGGDPDNFTYPRYDLDISFFRVYEKGRPASTPEYLHWSREGAREGELTLLAGNPAETSRLDTVAQLEYLRDYSDPLYLERLASRIKLLKAYRAQSEQHDREARELIFGFENSYKAVYGELEGLKEPRLMNAKRESERKLRAAVERNAALAKRTGKVWDEVAAAYKTFAPHSREYDLLENGPMGSTLFRLARWTLRLPAEKAKPNEQRLREYRDSALQSLELRLFSKAPIYGGVETVILTQYFEELEKWLGAGHPAVKAALAGRSPAAAARSYVAGTHLQDVAVRKRLSADAAGARGSSDPMMRLLAEIDAAARAVRKIEEDSIEAVVTQSKARIEAARLAVYGANDYPDATFTPRVSYGPVKGYQDKTGQPVPAFTNFAGMYRHATGKDPYRLPPRWEKAKGVLNPEMPLNFVTTADITGGNSGSPTVNTRNEIVGIVFDGNIESLPLVFLYDDLRARAVHVASQGIIEALRKLYRSNALVDELLPPAKQ